MRHLGDITQISGYEAPAVEVVIGGSPCQDLSVAGKREGLSGERSGLFMEQIRIIKEMREKSEESGADVIIPRFMVWENVPGAFSSNKGEDFRIVLEETARVVEPTAVVPRPEKGKWTNAGVIVGDGWSIAWRVFDAQFWGVPQRRRRIALVADFGGATAPEILFERKGVFGDITQSATPWKDFAAAIAKRFGGTDRERATDRARAFDVIPLNTMVCTRQSSEARTCLGIGKTNEPQFAISTQHEHAVAYTEEVSPQSQKDIKNQAERESERLTFCIQGNSIDRADTAGCNGKGVKGGVSYTLNTIDRPAVYDYDRRHDKCHGEGGTVPTITGDHQNRVTDYTALCVRERCGCDGGGKGLLIQKDKSGTLAANNDQFTVCIGNGQANSLKPSEKAETLNCMHDQQAIVTLDRATFNQGKNAQYDFKIDDNGVNSTATSKGPSAVCSQSTVRRLTPLECERLQGFPDGWTDIGEYTDTNSKKRKTSDSARYKALGNSIALPSWAWLLERLNRYCRYHTMASLFDGIGGFPLIWEMLNGKGSCIWASEIEEFPIAVTKYHFGEEKQ